MFSLVYWPMFEQIICASGSITPLLCENLTQILQGCDLNWVFFCSLLVFLWQETQLKNMVCTHDRLNFDEIQFNTSTKLIQGHSND